MQTQVPSITLENLPAEEDDSYAFRVTAVTRQGASPPSKESLPVTFNNQKVPTLPSNFTKKSIIAISRGLFKVRLEWFPGQYATHYKISWRRKNNDWRREVVKELISSNKNSYTLSPIEEDVKYLFFIQAIRKRGKKVMKSKKFKYTIFINGTQFRVKNRPPPISSASLSQPYYYGNQIRANITWSVLLI